MDAPRHAPLIAAGAYFLLACGIAVSELHTRVFDRGNSEMAGLATYAITLPSSFVVDNILETGGRPIGETDSSFVMFCVASVLLNSVLVYSSAWAALRLFDRGGTG